MKYFFLISYLFVFNPLHFFVLGQLDFASDRISDCNGATKISRKGTFTFELPKDKGLHDDLAAYQDLKKFIKENNSIWITFEAPYDGEFLFESKVEGSVVQCVVFNCFSDEPCGGIYDGSAEVLRLLNPTKTGAIGLKNDDDENFLPSLMLKKGGEIKMFFNVQDSKNQKLFLDLDFIPTDSDFLNKSLSQIVDFRTKENYNLPYFNLKLRDAESGLPVVGHVVITGGKRNNAFYVGSDFIFPSDFRSLYNISVDAAGYFFYDFEYLCEGKEDSEFVLLMESISLGRQLNIRGIKFVSGSTDFAEGTDKTLKRLRDFLIQNSDIRIEIQGHVHELGEGSAIGMRLSSDRAKKIAKFLVDSGISKNRLEVKGYGNEKMLYPNPKSASEEQANRRVEILIIE